MGFDFSVEFKPGKMNIVADALSRRTADEPEEGSLTTLSTPQFDRFEAVRQEVTRDSTLSSLRTSIQAGQKSPQWAVVDGLITFDQRIYLPTTSLLLPSVIAAAHTTGHEGVQRTLHRLRADFHVPQARQLVQEFVRDCVTCQRNKTEHLHPGGLLQPLPIPEQIWSDVSMDFIEGLPRVNGKSVILTVVDRLSMYAHFIPLGHPYSASSVARVFFEEVVRLHGIPSSIVSDRDPIFTSNFWKELFKLSGIQLKMSSAFHPQTNGQSEAANKVIAMYLRCLTGDRPRQWLRWLPWAEYCFNTAYHSSLRETPFKLVYGRSPPSLRSYEKGDARVPAVEQSILDRDLFLSEVRERLHQAQEYAKLYYDNNHHEVVFGVGDWVWVRLLHRPAASIPGHRTGKLAPRFYGPYKVLSRIGDVAYKLELPTGAKIYDVFHVGVLKAFHGIPPEATPALPPLLHGRVLPNPTKVVRARKARDAWQLLVQWEGQPSSDATWEDANTFKAKHLEFQLAEAGDSPFRKKKPRISARGRAV
jgi:hypothetical protein